MKASFKSAIAAVALAALNVGAAAPAQAQVRRYITFENACGLPVRLYVSHADGYRNWHAHGPFVLSAYQGATRLDANGIILTQTEDHDLYFYAETTNGTVIWDGTAHAASFNGVTYMMRRAPVAVVGGELGTRLTCN